MTWKPSSSSKLDMEVAVVTKPVVRYVSLRRAAHITNTKAEDILEAIEKNKGWENSKYEVTAAIRWP